MSAVVVRDAAPEDGAAIAHVRTRTWQVAYAHIFTREQLATISEEAAVERWAEIIRSQPQETYTLVASVAEGVVGFASLGPARGELDDGKAVGELYAIYVLPESSGSGIGQALMAETLSRLRKDGFAEAVLWVLEDNPRTRRFYELASWRPDGSFKDEEWLGTLVREVRYRISLEPTT